MFAYRVQLAKIWVVWACLLFLFLAYRSMIGGYGDGADGVWRWFLPNLMPTLALIVTVDTFDVGNATATSAGANTTHRFAQGLSIVYLLLLTAPIVLEPLREGNTLPFLMQSNLWLGPLQGLVTAALGFFFVKKGVAGK
jgi:hypothetical protein